MITPERVCVCCVWCSGEALGYRIGPFILPPAGWCCGPRGQLACSWQHAQQMATAEASAPPAAAPEEAPAAPPAAAPVEAPAAAPAAPAEASTGRVQVPAVAAVQMPIELLDRDGRVIAVSNNGVAYGQEEAKA